MASRSACKGKPFQGQAPWLDEEAILPGQDWDYEIEEALETSDFVLVFLSARSVGKIGYVQREFRRALYRSEEMPEGHIHTIPVKLDNCEVPRRFRRHQFRALRKAQAEREGIPAPCAQRLSAGTRHTAASTRSPNSGAG